MFLQSIILDRQLAGTKASLVSPNFSVLFFLYSLFLQLTIYEYKVRKGQVYGPLLGHRTTLQACTVATSCVYYVVSPSKPLVF